MNKNTIIIVILIVFGIVTALTHYHYQEERKLDKLKTDAEYKVLLDAYNWKTERLRIYTDIIYRNE